MQDRVRSSGSYASYCMVEAPVSELAFADDVVFEPVANTPIAGDLIRIPNPSGDAG